jgi:hypothetical protein
VIDHKEEGKMRRRIERKKENVGRKLIEYQKKEENFKRKR